MTLIQKNLQKYQTEVQKDAFGYKYSTVTNDENKVRTYILENGLTVFLAQNFDAPRIQTYIPVRTGSNNDPADNTGLSHYLEHMLFKGSAKIGTSNWQEEGKLLNEISELYELHKAETDPEKKKEIYKKIDSISHEASQYAIANEYDKIISSLGATATNAHTWLDETVYKNNIPNNELENWLRVESERFSKLVLRLFHTELESVYEEFNRAQDNDSRLANYALMEELFPTHPNGQQTTLGRAEHLKNPSMKAIYKYFDEFYVPNNYAVVLVGDFEFEPTIQLIDQYFGQFQFKELPAKTNIIERPLESIQKRTVKSPTIPRVQIAWRTDSYGSRQALLADVVANILSNSGEAGLLDLNINQEQKMLYSQAFSVGFKEYGYFSVVAVPKESQTLDEGIELVLSEIEKVKSGDFPDWLLPAIINDFKLQRLKGWETANGLATTIYDTYIKNRIWEDELKEMPEYESFSKQDVIDFAIDFFKDNYVVIYKEKGENENLIRIDNPGITPIQLNRDGQSDFAKFISEQQVEEIKPFFINYKKEIEEVEIDGKKLSFVKNKYNNVAQVHYVFPFGSDHDKELALAVFVLQYLGTGKYSPSELKEEFYKIGVVNDYKINRDSLIISLHGLEENIIKGVELLDHWMKEVEPDQEAYDRYVESVVEAREAAKTDKTKIMKALTDYAKWGKLSYATDVLSKEYLQQISCEVLMRKVKKLLSFSYQVFYYGRDFEGFKSSIPRFIDQETYSSPEIKVYPEPETTGKVYFVNYDMVQMEMTKVAKGENVDAKKFGTINVFNEYFGRGLSSIVFQEIREKRSLAYSAYVSYQANQQSGHPDYVMAYVGTQPDKLHIAVSTMNELMSSLPQIPLQFETAKKAVLKQIASTRFTRTNIFFNYLNLQKLGVEGDLRKDMYNSISTLSLDQLTDFYDKNLKSLTFNAAVIGKKENLDMKAVEKMGEFVELGLEEIFGY